MSTYDESRYTTLPLTDPRTTSTQTAAIPSAAPQHQRHYSYTDHVVQNHGNMIHNSSLPSWNSSGTQHYLPNGARQAGDRTTDIFKQPISTETLRRVSVSSLTGTPQERAVMSAGPWPAPTPWKSQTGFAWDQTKQTTTSSNIGQRSTSGSSLPSHEVLGTYRDTATFPPRNTNGMSINDLISRDRPAEPSRSPKAATTQNSPTSRPNHPIPPKRARSTSVRTDFETLQNERLQQQQQQTQYYQSLQQQQTQYHPQQQQQQQQQQPQQQQRQPQQQQQPQQPSPRNPQPFHVDLRGPNVQAIQIPVNQSNHGFREPASAPVSTTNQYTSSNSFSRYRNRQDVSRQQFTSSRNNSLSNIMTHQEAERSPAWQGTQQHEMRDTVTHQPMVDSHLLNLRTNMLAATGPNPSQAGTDRQMQANHVYNSDQSKTDMINGHHKRPLYEQGSREDVYNSRQNMNSSLQGSNPDRLAYDSRYVGNSQVQQDQPGMSLGELNRDTQQRNYLPLSPDIHRTGRSSPLPQAVQGAQLKFTGPGRDFSIKNEFGRMFSGLGSGVGGQSTPGGYIAPAQKVNAVNTGNDDQYRHNVEHNHYANLIRDEGHTLTGDHKRIKTGHINTNLPQQSQHHHHHHHGHVHGHHHNHHHHHHSTVEESHAQPLTTITTAYPSNGTSNIGSNSHHHHHHHHVHPGQAHSHHHSHHNHHATTALPKSEPKMSRIEIDNSSLLSKIPSEANLPHLGSCLYDSISQMPSVKRAMLDTKTSLISTSTPMPRFMDPKPHSLFTVRVPREYLSRVEASDDVVSGGLEGICNRRAIWGTEIYTDDSDVVAAAVHSGWIRGDFGIFDDDLRDIFPDEFDEKSHIVNDDTKSLENLERKPVKPVNIPERKDMHITVLLLPGLERYTSTNMHHVTSRSWDDGHDGLSFAIWKIKFVDESRANRYMDRKGKARKDGLKDIMKRREAVDALMGLGNKTMASRVVHVAG